MVQRYCSDLPAVMATARTRPEDTVLKEVLLRQPSGEGSYLWIRARKTGLSTHQARQAIARSLEVPVNAISHAGSRDRNTVCEQWFSVEKDLSENPGGIANAGYKRMLKVLQVVEHHRPVDARSGVALAWQCTLVGGNKNDGYLRAKAIWDRLRTGGIPNYFGSARWTAWEIGQMGSPPG